MNNHQGIRLDMKRVLEIIFRHGSNKAISMVMSSEAEELYEEYHGSIVEFRSVNLYDETKVSVMSKSLGLVMRLSGIIMYLLRY